MRKPVPFDLSLPLFCSKVKPGEFRHFYPSTLQVNMCGTGLTVVEVRVIVSDDGTYFGWWDAKRNSLSMIYPNIHATRMCFPYGPEVLEERGEGLLVRLRVEEIA